MQASVQRCSSWGANPPFRTSRQYLWHKRDMLRWLSSTEAERSVLRCSDCMLPYGGTVVICNLQWSPEKIRGCCGGGGESHLFHTPSTLHQDWVHSFSSTAFSLSMNNNRACWPGVSLSVFCLPSLSPRDADTRKAGGPVHLGPRCWVPGTAGWTWSGSIWAWDANSQQSR